MATKNTENKTTGSQNFTKSVPLNKHTKGKGNEATFKDMVLNNNINIEDKEVHKDSALDALKDDELLTHFLLNEFDGLRNIIEKELETIQTEKKRMQGKKNEKREAVGNKHVRLYPSPAAVGTSEFDIQVEDVLNTIRKHDKTEDIAEMVANGKHPISKKLNKPVSQNNNTKGKGIEATLEDLDLQNNNRKEKDEDDENTALAALEEDDMKWLTHFLLTELDEMFIALQEWEKKQKGVKRMIIVKKSATNNRISEQMVMKKNQKQLVLKKQIEKIHKTWKRILRKRDLHWYPLPAAVGSPEYNIRIQEVLDTIKKHVKTNDVVKLPDDKEDDLPVINFNISEYFRSLGQDNKLVDSEK